MSAMMTMALGLPADTDSVASHGRLAPQHHPLASMRTKCHRPSSECCLEAAGGAFAFIVLRWSSHWLTSSTNSWWRPVMI
mmetsp:Transcript_67390/g.173515  ORF Transcript_67390/g.173515 Transcript_67390/m.173515 type:complete len:80 (+) Transcript_67390:195-434(+)